MTESANLRNELPDLGGPFLYWDQNENEKKSYTVETPYGFQLDLDFLKYVEDIQSGQSLKKLQVSRKLRVPRHSTSSLKSLSSQTDAWVSIESLDLSEDGTSDSVFLTGGRTETNSSHAKETLAYRKSNPLSPMSIFKLLPPPPAKTILKNSQVEKTLQETSRRLQQEELNLSYVGIQGRSCQPSNLSKLSNASRSSPNLSQTSLTVYQNKSGKTHTISNQCVTGSIKISPVTSGLSTPSVNLSSAHLQYIREQMAASLKQLKDLEEQVKIIPALQVKISILERENKQLNYDLERQKTSTVNNGQANVTDSTLNKMDRNNSDRKVVQSEQKSNSEPTVYNINKITKLRRLTEKLSDPNRKMAGEKLCGYFPAVKEKTCKSVAVGEDVNIADSVFYYRSRQENYDVAVQAFPETKDVGEWVMESLLGLSSEEEKEIQLLQHTVEHQRAVISMLEDHVKAASDELEELRIAVASRQAIGVMKKDMTLVANPVESLVDLYVPPDRKLFEDGLKMAETGAIIPANILNSNAENLARNIKEELEEVSQLSTKQKTSELSEELITVVDSKDFSPIVPCDKNEDKVLIRIERNFNESSEEKDKRLTTETSPYIIDGTHSGNEEKEDLEGRTNIWYASSTFVDGLCLNMSLGSTEVNG